MAETVAETDAETVAETVAETEALEDGDCPAALRVKTASTAAMSAARLSTRRIVGRALTRMARRSGRG